METKINSCFEPIIGYDNLKITLSKYIDMLKKRGKYEAKGIKIPHSILLYGEPGLGKTFISECFSKGLDRKTYIIRKDNISKNIVKKITKSFDEAIINQPALIVIDDLDKFSNNDYEHQNSDEFITIQSCLDRIDNNDVFVFFTANDIEPLPTSLRRRGRIDAFFEVPFPLKNDIKDIFKYYLSKKKNVGNIDYDELACLFSYYSCASLETVVNSAAIYAGYENHETIEMEDFEKVVLYEETHIPEIGCKKYDKEKYAFLVAGEVVVREILEPGSVYLATTLSMKNEWGKVFYLYNEICKQNEQSSVNQIKIGFSKMAANEYKFGVFKNESEYDDYETSEIIDTNIMFLGHQGYDYLCGNQDITQEKKNNILKIRSKLLEKYYEESKRIIINNIDVYERIAKLLIDKEIIRKKDIQEIMKTKKIVA